MKKLFLAIAALFVAMPMWAAADKVAPARALLERIAPQQAEQFSLELLKGKGADRCRSAACRCSRHAW